MSQYTEFFLKSKSNVVMLDTLQISHPNFSQTYYIVRNATNGITAKLEDGTIINFQYYPLRITPTASSDDLDQILKIEFGDVGEILAKELDAVARADGFGVKPSVVYRSYRSDDLSGPMDGPYNFVVNQMPFSQDGVAFEATAPKVNLNSTGEIYTPDRFPMLAGFL